MQARNPEPQALNDMLCSKCHRPYEITVTINQAGKREIYLQCWGCMSSIKLNTRPRKNRHLNPYPNL